MRAALLFAALLATLPARGEVPRPAVAVDPGRGECIAPPAEMRRKHMDMLRHQRDRTLRQGERGAQVSLNGCVSCHAGKESGSVAAGSWDFCQGCHAYAAVRIDCFECHQAKAQGAKP